MQIVPVKRFISSGRTGRTFVSPPPFTQLHYFQCSQQPPKTRLTIDCVWLGACFLRWTLTTALLLRLMLLLLLLVGRSIRRSVVVTNASQYLSKEVIVANNCQKPFQFSVTPHLRLLLLFCCWLGQISSTVKPSRGEYSAGKSAIVVGRLVQPTVNKIDNQLNWNPRYSNGGSPPAETHLRRSVHVLHFTTWFTAKDLPLSHSIDPLATHDRLIVSAWTLLDSIGIAKPLNHLPVVEHLLLYYYVITLIRVSLSCLDPLERNQLYR